MIWGVIHLFISLKVDVYLSFIIKRINSSHLSVKSYFSFVIMGGNKGPAWRKFLQILRGHVELICSASQSIAWEKKNDIHFWCIPYHTVVGYPCVSSRRYSYSVGLHLLLAKGPHDSVLHEIHYSYFISSNGSSLKLRVPAHAYNMFHFLLYDDGFYLLACLLIAVTS